MKILFVCLGNICRSPLAAGILKQQIQQLGLNWQVDSAGLANKFIGCSADPRVVNVAKQHGIDLSVHEARKFNTSDFDQYDLIVTMDDELAKRLRAKAINSVQEDKVWLLADFLLGLGGNLDIPDPYFWEESLFEELFIKMEQACKVLVETYNTSAIYDLYNHSMDSIIIKKRA